MRRRLAVAFWRVVNPVNRPFAGRAPWWVLLETTGGRTGKLRRTPLAAGPSDGTGMWLLAVHGRHSGWVRNLESSPEVRVRHRGSWRRATASVHALDDEVLKRFNAYARTGPRVLGIDPVLVRLGFGEHPTAS